MSTQTSTIVLMILLTLAMVVFPIGMGLFYLLNPEGTWRFTENRLRRVGIVAAYRTSAWERRRVLGGIISITIGIIFCYVLLVNFAPLLGDPTTALAVTPMDGVFVTATPLGR